jgi:ribosome maturation factor RimP
VLLIAVERLHKKAGLNMAHGAEQLQSLLRPTVESMGFELWGLELVRARQLLLRVYIDANAGITVDDCAAVSHQISGVLDVEDPIKGDYLLEVSSPGMDRPLFSAQQCGRYVGERVQLRLLVPVAGRRRFSAMLLAVEGERLSLEQDGETFQVSFQEVDKANLVPQFD